VPNASAASATDVPPPASKTWIDPIGGSTTGMRSRCPPKPMLASTFDTSFNTRGRNASESSAMRLRLSDASVSAPPTR
jgi:hypothetical protein